MKTLVVIKMEKNATRSLSEINKVLVDYDLIVFVNKKHKFWVDKILSRELDVGKCKKDFYFFDKVNLQLLNFLNEKNVTEAEFFWFK